MMPLVTDLVDPISTPSLRNKPLQGGIFGEETTELASNIIAESMYAKCDVDRNEYCY